MAKKIYELDTSVGYLIYMINQRIFCEFKANLEKEGVNMVETWVLLQIHNEITTSHGIQKILKIDMAQIQRACDRLVREKLIMRKVNPFDKRVKDLSLTEEGDVLIKRLIQHAKKLNAKALSPLNTKENENLHQLLLKVFYSPFCQSDES